MSIYPKRRLGKFRVSNQFVWPLWEGPDGCVEQQAMRLLMDNCIVLRAEHHEGGFIIEYEALSPEFEECEAFCCAPYYEARFECEVVDGKLVAKWGGFHKVEDWSFVKFTPEAQKTIQDFYQQRHMRVVLDGDSDPDGEA